MRMERDTCGNEKQHKKVITKACVKQWEEMEKTSRYRACQKYLDHGFMVTSWASADAIPVWARKDSHNFRFIVPTKYRPLVSARNVLLIIGGLNVFDQLWEGVEKLRRQSESNPRPTPFSVVM